MTSSNGNIFSRYCPFLRGIHRSPVNSPFRSVSRKVRTILCYICPVVIILSIRSGFTYTSLCYTCSLIILAGLRRWYSQVFFYVNANHEHNLSTRLTVQTWNNVAIIVQPGISLSMEAVADIMLVNDKDEVENANICTPRSTTHMIYSMYYYFLIFELPRGCAITNNDMIVIHSVKCFIGQYNIFYETPVWFKIKHDYIVRENMISHLLPHSFMICVIYASE